jgi:hypothetical protein
MSRRTYDKAFELAAGLINQGKPVIIDASFSSRADRAEAMKLAVKLQIPFYFIECVCPDEIVKMRLEKRRQEQDNPSDGRWEILMEQKKHYEPVDEIPAGRYFQIDTSANPEMLRRDIVRSIKMAE